MRRISKADQGLSDGRRRQKYRRCNVWRILLHSPDVERPELIASLVGRHGYTRNSRAAPAVTDAEIQKGRLIAIDPGAHRVCTRSAGCFSLDRIYVWRQRQKNKETVSIGVGLCSLARGRHRDERIHDRLSVYVSNVTVHDTRRAGNTSDASGKREDKCEHECGNFHFRVHLNPIWARSSSAGAQPVVSR